MFKHFILRRVKYYMAIKIKPLYVANELNKYIGINIVIIFESDF